MARKNILHRSKFNEFCVWLNEKGIAYTTNAAQYEVLRWKADHGPMPIIFDGKSSEHFSCNEASLKFIHEFINCQRKPLLDRDTVKSLALANGFKLKDQGNGVMDLNPYVYDFAAALMNRKK